MSRRHVLAKSATAARRKAGHKTVTVTKVTLIKRDAAKGGMNLYAVTTRRKISHTKRGWGQDKRRHSKESWEVRYRKSHRKGRHHRRHRKHGSKKALKKAWRTRHRKYGKSGFSAAGRRKIARNLR